MTVNIENDSFETFLTSQKYLKASHKKYQKKENAKYAKKNFLFLFQGQKYRPLLFMNKNP